MKPRIVIYEIALFGMFSALMLVSKMMMEWLPNIHLLGTFIVAITVVYRSKALIPIYAYVMLDGLLHGFSAWWLPYLYIWTVLWGAVMLLPRGMSPKVARIVYMTVSAAHGFLFGILYAPVQAVLFGLDGWGMFWWIVKGLPYDAIHGVSNLLSGVLILPLVDLLYRGDRIARQ